MNGWTQAYINHKKKNNQINIIWLRDNIWDNKWHNVSILCEEK